MVMLMPICAASSGPCGDHLLVADVFVVFTGLCLGDGCIGTTQRSQPARRNAPQTAGVACSPASRCQPAAAHHGLDRDRFEATTSAWAARDLTLLQPSRRFQALHRSDEGQISPSLSNQNSAICVSNAPAAGWVHPDHDRTYTSMLRS
jgi:hypothetical protein